MKTLLLIRHAKSSWNDLSLPDFERKLNDRGKSDAKVMAKRVKQKDIDIDLFVSSPAKRARKTAKIFMEELDTKKKNLQLIPSLYESSVQNFYNVVENLDSKENVVALFAHNPGITEFINSLKCSAIDDMPTCAVFALNIKSEDWKDFREAEKEFLFFDYPKNEDI